MKNTYKILLLILGVITLTFTYSNLNTNASNLKHLEKFPNEIKGTWYMYKKDYGSNKKTMKKTVINKKEMDFHPYRKHKIINTLYQTKKQEKKYIKTSKWTYIYEEYLNGHKWLELCGWQSKQYEDGNGACYSIYKNHGNKVLLLGIKNGKSKMSVIYQYYQKKSLAKKFNQKRYHGFNYDLMHEFE